MAQSCYRTQSLSSAVETGDFSSINRQVGHSIRVSYKNRPILLNTVIQVLLYRYGLMGVNGCGKSTLLACLGNREVPIQDHIDIYYLARYCHIINIAGNTVTPGKYLHLRRLPWRLSWRRTRRE